MKKFFFIVGVIVFSFGFLGCSSVSSPVTNESGVKKVKVVTTLFPLYDFVKNVGGDKVDVTLLLPPGVEPHSFDPKPSDIVKINQADIFVYTGEFMEPWAKDVIDGVSNENMIVVDASAGIELMKDLDSHEEEEGDDHGGVDPHIWLDFDNAAIMVDNIASALIKSDSADSAFYENNVSDYKARLFSLDERYKSELKTCKVREIIYGGHYAFGYLADRYDLGYVAAQGFSPDSEPTPAQMINMVEQIRVLGAKYVFYEELVLPTIAETLAQETGVKMLKLNAAHNLTRDDFENGLSFLSVMGNNLNTLKQGLECE